MIGSKGVVSWEIRRLTLLRATPDGPPWSGFQQPLTDGPERPERADLGPGTEVLDHDTM